MDRISSWLCPTEHHRARALEANARVRTARTMAAVTCGLSLLAMAPFVGWWFLLLFGTSAAVLLSADRRIERSDRPEIVIALNGLAILAVLAAGTALSGGEASPALPWLVLPAALSAARFRPQVVIVGAAITAAAMAGVCVGADPQGVVDDPTRLISTLTLLIAITAVMTALMESELEHRDRAVLDPLTGLLNRASLDARMLEIEEQAHLTGGAVSLILLDLDGFKAVNDDLGHAVGDETLRDIAQVLMKHSRGINVVSRYGGDEFAILLVETSKAGARLYADRIRQVIGAFPFSHGKHVTASLGVASVPDDEAATAEDLFRAADEALYTAKRAGKNQVAAIDHPEKEAPWSSPETS